MHIQTVDITRNEEAARPLERIMNLKIEQQKPHEDAPKIK